MVRDFSQKTIQELYETIRVNVDEEEQWKVFDFVEDFFMEELEIGDYINDINSYHLHMFDKHDVTTKKFDAIVERVGKVDANYAAQIEGYCSLLGEYRKKFEAVCAMLQPEKLRLSPDKYREKLEGINTGYQNARDTHEQEQSAYEEELYEIETVWYKKMLDKAEDYLIRSAECIVLGNFTDEVTLLGVAGQITLGIFDLDLPCDIRDIIADIKNLAETDRVRWDLIGMLALDLIGLIPVIGALKYSDEVGTLFKNADKVSVVARSTDGAGVLAKHADEAGAWLHGVKVFRYSDETAEAVASGEKLLKESGTIYESFADMMSPEDAKRYLDFLENGSREGLTSAEKADALLVSQKVEYEDVWDLRNVGDALESGSYSNLGNMSYEDGKQYSSWNSLREEGLSYEQVEKIKFTPKGEKPLPETYLSNDYINNHLQSFKESGAVKIMPNEPTGTIGGKGGTFVMSGDELNEIIQYADGDVSKIETILGLDQGYLGENPVVVTIKDTSSIRIPSGNELGAWPEYWKSGGYTSGGVKEAVVDPAVEGTYTYKHLFE